MHPNRRDLMLSLLAPLALGACASLRGPRQVDVSERRLLALISRQFPVKKRYLELLEFELSDPMLRLMPEENRVGTRLNFAAGTTLNRAQPWTGQMALSYALRYEASDQTVRLDAVRLEGFDLDGAPPAYAKPLRGAGTHLAENLLQGLVVHRFKPEDLRSVEGLGYQPGVLTVVPGGLRLQLDPTGR
ncbi:MAG: hypothetical protein R3E42_12525 [Burkholderiaceae bacterium]